MPERTHLSLPNRAHARLTSLKERLGETTATEVVKRSLHLMDKMATEIEQGGTIFVKRPDGTMVEFDLLLDLPKRTPSTEEPSP
jgi:ubiquinone biosynthesis protein Coq4